MRGLGLGAILLLVACSADVDRRSEAVIGGMAVDEAVFPAAGALVVEGTFFCSGTLITPNAVLTAGHCLDPMFLGPRVPDFTFVADTTGGVPAGQVYRGAERIPHPAFDLFTPDGQLHDIGLLILAESVPGVEPVPLVEPADAARISVGDPVDIVGYGLTDPFGGEGGVKHHGLAVLTAIDTWLYQIGPNGGVQNCNGDSGGPAFWEIAPGQPRVIGVVTGGPEPCTMGGFDIRVDAHYDWLVAELGGEPTPPVCDAPRTLCGDACVDLMTDPLYCGTCDVGCPSGERCEGGRCFPPGVSADAGAPDAGAPDGGLFVLDAGGEPTPMDDGGCSCRVRGRSTRTAWPLGLLGLAMLTRRAARRRRRRRPPSPRGR